MFRKLICAVMCVITLTGCGIATMTMGHKVNNGSTWMVEEGSVSPFIAKLTEPYVSDNFPDELTIGYQFQNNLTQVGDYMTVGHLKITVYNEENVVIGHEVIDAQYWFHHKMELGEQDAVLGKTTMKLRWAPKDGAKLRIVGETFIGIEEGFTLSNTVEYTVHREKQ